MPVDHRALVLTLAISVAFLCWRRSRMASQAAAIQEASKAPAVEEVSKAPVAQTALPAEEQQPAEEEVSAPTVLSQPAEGYLVATTVPGEGFGGFIPEDAQRDGPSSTDSSEEDDESDKSWVSFRGRREAREGSFRQRTDEKIERAKGLKVQSSSLLSHLCTPSQHNRNVDRLLERKLMLDPETLPPPGSRTVATSYRRLNAADGKEQRCWDEFTRTKRSQLPPIPEFRRSAASGPGKSNARLSPIPDTPVQTEDDGHERAPEAELQAAKLLSVESRGHTPNAAEPSPVAVADGHSARGADVGVDVASEVAAALAVAAKEAANSSTKLKKKRNSKAALAGFDTLTTKSLEKR